MQRYSKIATKIIFSLFLTLGTTTNAEETFNTHGISAYGDLKYAADYMHFEYVNPNAPQGGTLRLRILNLHMPRYHVY